MSDFKLKIRQKLLDEDYYHYSLQSLDSSMKNLLKVTQSVKDPYMEPMVDMMYQLMNLEYTAGKPIEEIATLMGKIIVYTQKTQDFIDRKAQDTWEKRQVMIELFSKLDETEILPNLLGLCILFNRDDWLKIIVKAIGPFDNDIVIDSLISMKIPDYPITDEKQPKAFYFRKMLLKAIQAKTKEDTLTYLDNYLRCWYDSLRKLGYNVYVDTHLSQEPESRKYCGFYGYWAFEAAAVVYLKKIDDSSLYKYLYYPKDMVIYARKNNPC